MSEYYSEKQKAVIRNANRRWNILYGATRSGKTVVSFSLALLHINEHLNDNILFTGKTLNTIERNVFEPMRERFGKRFIGEIVNKKEIMIFGKKCYVIGANDERAITKIQGMGIGYAYCDELTTYPENFFQMLKSRLDAPNACCDATCNPESPSHFVKQFIDKPGVDVYAEHFSIYDNPFLTPDFVQALETEYRGTIYFDKWILGNWVKAEGLVYPLFKRERHFLTEEQYSRIYGKGRVRYVIFGVDGANTNDSTCICPLAIMDNGQGVVLKLFYHNPKINGQLSNEQLIPHILRYIRELESEYQLGAAEYYTAVDSAAGDLRLSLAYHLPDYFNVCAFSKKDLSVTTDTVNNAFSRNALCLLNYGGHFNYIRNKWKEEPESQLVRDLELMTWDDKRDGKFDDSIPNDCADAFRYAVCAYYNNPANIWETPDPERRYKEVA